MVELPTSPRRPLAVAGPSDLLDLERCSERVLRLSEKEEEWKKACVSHWAGPSDWLNNLDGNLTQLNKGVSTHVSQNL